MPTIKLNKWDSEQLHYMCDKEDKMDMCIYVNGQKIKVDPSSSDETDDGIEHTFSLDEEVTEELGEGKHTIAIRVNGKGVEKHKLIISNPEADEEDNED